MTSIFYLIPISVCLGLGAVAAFIWSIRASQYDDLEGDAHRIFEEDDRPIDPDH